MKPLIFVAVLLVCSQATAHDFMVLDVHGPATVSRPNKGAPMPVHNGVLIPEFWRFGGGVPVRITLLCPQQKLAVASRHQSPLQVCSDVAPLRESQLVRFRDENAPNLPVLLRPRGQNVVSLLPIRWRYNTANGVDLTITDLSNGAEHYLGVAPGESQVLEDARLSKSLLPGHSYRIRICHSGSSRRCNSEDSTGPFRILDKQARHTLDKHVSAVEKSATRLDVTTIRSAVYFMNGYYDDALWLLQQVQEPNNEQRFLMAKSAMKLQQYRLGEHLLQQVLATEPQPEGSPTLLHSLSCLNLKSLRENYEHQAQSTRQGDSRALCNPS